MPELNQELLTRPPWLTADLPGIGGVIKERLEDFIVEEIPAYLPCGAGEHLYLWIEKHDMGAEYFQRQLAQRLGIASGEVGTAGLKDRRAITRQWVSVPAACEERVAQLDGDGIRVLQTSKHGNKLRPGHLHGNRFEIVIRHTVSRDSLPSIIESLQRLGLPNYYGAQRFGRDHETLQLGWNLLHGERLRVSGFLRKLALSAVQSALFNSYVRRRLHDGLFRQVLQGDVMSKWPAGGMFVCTDTTIDQERFDRREILHTGPMFGSKMRQATDAALERELAVLQNAQLTLDQFRTGGKLLEGTRRWNLIYLDQLEASSEGDTVILKFTLPAGSYATVLLSEIMKTETIADGD